MFERPRGLLLPAHVHARVRQNREAKATTPIAPGPARHKINTDDFVSHDDIAEQVARFMEYEDTIPNATGWSIMVLMLTIPEVSAGGVIMDHDYTQLRTRASPQGIVAGIGPAAYNPKDDRFPSGPWCQIGDRVLYARYAGKPFQLSNGQELAFLTDTDIIATVEGGWLATPENE